MRILVTCPPMLRQMPLLEEEFSSRGWKASTPEVIQTLSVAQLCQLVPEHDGWIIGDDPANAQVVRAAAAGSLRAAVKWGVGTDNVDFAAFQASGIPVTNTPGMFGNEVADVALGYVIGLARHTFEIHQGVVKGTWPKPTGMSLSGKTVGLIGFGDIGRQLARRLQTSGMNIQVYDPAVKGADVLGPTVSIHRWPDALHHCDFLCFTCALTPDNRHMLNADTLPFAKKGVRVINVARGPLIDEKALVSALESGHVASVALDVFEEEPLEMGNALRRFPQNVFGSHNASNTLDAVLRTSRAAVQLLEERLR